MQTTSKWMDGICFVATGKAGYSVVMEGSATEGCVKRDSSPMEILPMGVAGYSGTDVVMIIEKQRQGIIDYQAAVTTKHTGEPPRMLTEIHIHFTVTEHGLKADVVEQVVWLFVEKYCSASIMLDKMAKIIHSLEIVET